ncbi:phenylalanine 4-monooxygenase [Pseudobdellovibrio exovorus JSS]|uniref:Phenylalanine 4-monooxygenase n=2 Tax=Pseudobdellovibrio exovorus TaxID=453816 RepID=M4VB84_9BACT|nr:phenylalanine 4-monooxygenase [Pseudobdellovibrio exovorus JSS]
MERLPSHLQKYIVKQDYEKYTALDHAVWRYILRQLKSYLSVHAHASYLEGLEKTGIDIEQIPRIENISAHLEKFGWRALPVSGFIPPAAFMELQSLSVLPIASDMRSLDHLLYTPAPDIVHEAAGHAPIIADPEYAEYLKQYAQVAKKAIISKEDLELYEAIRELSDVKENPASTPEEIKASDEKLVRVSKSISFTSEASELSRMNWWTAEYGLIGDIKKPKIFGAGLLSSVGESQWCLSDNVKKIPLSLACIHQSYDITEPQPQLYVARDFKHLSEVLEELSETMAYKLGGRQGLDKAVQAESVNTVELNTGLQISGTLKKYLTDAKGQPAYLQFVGPTQLCFADREIEGHANTYHKDGYGTPVGNILNFSLESLQIGQIASLNYESGVQVSGRLTQIQKVSETSKAVVLSFENATAQFKDEILFRPEWGIYDIVLGEDVSSVFGGPADRVAYGEFDDFVAKRVPPPQYSENQKKLFSFYQKLRDLRADFKKSGSISASTLQEQFQTFKAHSANEWLLFVELLEMAIKAGLAEDDFKNHLQSLAAQNTKHRPLIEEGIKLAYEKF